jgi:hypothetical protein
VRDVRSVFSGVIGANGDGGAVAIPESRFRDPAHRNPYQGAAQAEDRTVQPRLSDGPGRGRASPRKPPPVSP